MPPKRSASASTKPLPSAKYAKTTPIKAAPAKKAVPAIIVKELVAAEADVIIISSKVCNAFKTRAATVAAAVAVAHPAVTVVIDEQKAEGRNPDRGTFKIVVRGTTILDLPTMVRPFSAMKALSMNVVCAQVLAAI